MTATAKHRERAREIVGEWADPLLVEEAAAQHLASMIAKALAAAHAEGREEMRKEAAKVAAEFDYDGEFPDENKMPQGWAGCRRLIAAAIRALPKDTGK